MVGLAGRMTTIFDLDGTYLNPSPFRLKSTPTARRNGPNQLVRVGQNEVEFGARLIPWHLHWLSHSPR